MIVKEKTKIGVIREGKVPPDMRVPLTPKQCKQIEALYPHVEMIIQRSAVRKYTDEQYAELGLKLQDNLENCDIIVGVKEVNVEDLIPNKKYLFFSHTFKKQPYNRKLLQAILEKHIQLIDWEVLKDKHGKRLIGFGRYAGIVGCYNAFRTYGLKHQLYSLKPAHLCADRKEVEQELKKVHLPANTKIILTGYGRVGHGAGEIIDLLPISEVSPTEFVNQTFDKAVYTHLEAEDYYSPKAGGEFVKADFYNAPETYVCTFDRFVSVADMYIPCHFWNNKADVILSQEDLQRKDRKLTVIADISCDIAGPIASTIRPSKISDPIYGYDPATGLEVDFMQPNAIAVMAVDNLPCELPLDASEDFGGELIKHILPALLGNDPDDIIGRGSQTDLNGKLTPRFAYLEDYVNQIS